MTLSSLQRPLVSVVIPAYNSAEFLPRTLSSVIRQTYDFMEIIIVDDGSKDNTSDIVAEFMRNDSRILFFSKENGGVSSARNFGIAKASGKYIAFVDSDDLWHPEKIQRQVDVLERNSAFAACYTLHYIIDRQSKLSALGQSVSCDGFIYARHLVLKFIGNGSTLLIRSDAVATVGGYDASYAARGIGGCEDLDYELRIFERFQVGVVPERLVGYRRYQGNMSSNHRRMALGMLETVECSIARVDALGAFAKRAARAKAAHYAMFKLLKGGEIRLAGMAAARLLYNDPNLAIHSFRYLVKRRIEKWRAAMRGKGSEAIGHSDEDGRLDFDVLPAEKIVSRTAHAGDHALLLKLEAEDHRLFELGYGNRADAHASPASDIGHAYETAMAGN